MFAKQLTILPSSACVWTARTLLIKSTNSAIAA